MQTEITPEASEIIDVTYSGQFNASENHAVRWALTSPGLLQAMGLSKDEWVSCEDRLPEFK